jgi:ankyrin repeat protein
MFFQRELRRAIKTSDARQVTELMRAAPTKDIRLTKGWTPLHVAVRGGNKDVVSAILAAGADINALTDMYQTPLDVAQLHGHKRLAEFLRRKGALAAARISLHGAAACGDLSAAKKHVAAGVDMNALEKGQLPLCLALASHHWNVAKYLLNRKCDATKRQQDYSTPLHVAAAAGAPVPLLAKLLKLGARTDETDGGSWTPLCCAAEAGHVEIVDWLIDRGADVTWGRDRYSTPVYCALRGQHEELASHLIDCGAKSTLHQAAECNHMVRARQQLNAGARPNEMDDSPYGHTPLDIAIWDDSADMVALLLEFGADPNQQSHSFQGEFGMVGGTTSLHEAVLSGSAKLVKLLLAHGADPDITDAAGQTPIELANHRDRQHLAHLMEAHIDKQLSLSAAKAEIDPLYTVSKVAELLSVDDAFVLDLIKTRKVTGLHLDDKTVRITAGSIQRYIAKLSR